MAEEDDQDKQHEPSQKKLDDARKRGELPRSQDMSGAIAYAAMLLVMVTLGPWVVRQIGGVGIGLFDLVGEIAVNRPHTGLPLKSTAIWTALARGVLPLLALPGLLVLVVLLAQRTVVFAPGKIAPKASRISLLSNAKNKFGRSGLFEFAKSSLKLVIISAVLALFLLRRMDGIAASMTFSPRGVSVLMGELAVDFLAILVVVVGVFGVVDLIWQHAEHRRRNRMSHKELRDEVKESEGDPHMKMTRRRRAQEIAMNSMLADVAEASVVVVNPEHFAVALTWNPSFDGPPVCVAKGTDEIAARIREAAHEAGVPIHRDPPTARAIYAVTDVGSEIHPDQYRAVAAAIRFADRMRAMARSRLTD